MDLGDQIPGYQEAVAHEQLVRDAAFLPVNENICGFEVMPMTLQHYLILRASRNPLLQGATPSPLEVAAFLWILSPGYCQNPRKRKRFYGRVGRYLSPGMFKNTKRILAAARVVAGCKEYVKETFMDRPGSRKSVREEPDYYSDGAFLIARFGREYGWAPEQTLKLKMKAVFQFFKEMTQHQNAQLSPKDRLPLFNPSEEIRMDYFAKLNQEQN